jgi:hypothetical protein
VDLLRDLGTRSRRGVVVGLGLDSAGNSSTLAGCVTGVSIGPVFGTAAVASGEYSCWFWSKDESADVELSGVMDVVFESLVGLAWFSDLHNVSVEVRIDLSPVQLTLRSSNPLEGPSLSQA